MLVVKVIFEVFGVAHQPWVMEENRVYRVGRPHLCSSVQRVSISEEGKQWAWIYVDAHHNERFGEGVSAQKNI